MAIWGQKTKDVKNFVIKNAEIFCILLLAGLSYLFLFLNLGGYPLIDVDETRYVQIAREMFNSGNCVTPMLNFEPFLEKPPLYFWLSALSFPLFGADGEFSNFAARFANALMAVFAVFFTYFFGRKALGKRFGLISAIILLANVWFLIFSHIAILDLGFMALTAAAIYCALLVNFCKVERNKKVCWWFFYFFVGLSVLSKGLIGVAIPVGVVFFTFLLDRNLKEIFKPINILPGILIFLMVTIPWHYLVWKANAQAWIDMYIIKHHFARFHDSGLGLGRKQPFLFYIPVILAGFLPWTLNLLASLKAFFTPDKNTNSRRTLVYAGIWALFGFLFFSVSSTKLPTYILTIFPALALICGYFWWSYINEDKNLKWVKVSSALSAALFLFVGIAAFIVPKYIDSPYVEKAGGFIVPLAWLFIAVSVAAIFFIIKNKKVLLFSSNVVLIFGIITIATFKIFPFMTEFGQSELMRFASTAKAAGFKGEKNNTLSTFNFPAKYSVLNVYENKVNYILNDDLDSLKKSGGYVIIKNKNNDTDKFKNFVIIEKGEKYSLIKLR